MNIIKKIKGNNSSNILGEQELNVNYQMKINGTCRGRG